MHSRPSSIHVAAPGLRPGNHHLPSRVCCGRSRDSRAGAATFRVPFRASVVRRALHAIHAEHPLDGMDNLWSTRPRVPHFPCQLRRRGRARAGKDKEHGVYAAHWRHMTTKGARRRNRARPRGNGTTTRASTRGYHRQKPQSTNSTYEQHRQEE